MAWVQRLLVLGLGAATACGVAAMGAAAQEEGAKRTPPELAAKGAPLSPAAVRLAPSAVTLSADRNLPEAVRDHEKQRIAAAFDRDTSTSFAAFGRSDLTVEFGGKRSVAALRVFGKAPYRLTVKAGKAARVVASGIDLGALKDEVWNTLALPGAFEADSLALELEPAKSAGAGLAEIEIWGASLPGEAAAAGAQSIIVPAREGKAKPASIGGEKDNAADNTFTFDVPLASGQVRRAYLAYELNGLAHWNEVPRTINGQAAAGGHVRGDAAASSAQTETIAPALIVPGRNSIAFLPHPAATEPYEVRDVRLILEPHDGWNFVASLSASHGDAASTADGDPSTGWQPYPANAAEGSAAPVLVAQFSGLVATETLRLGLSEPLTGSLIVEAGGGDSWRTIANVNAGTLVPGRNDIALGSVNASALRLRFDKGDGRGAITELSVQGSPVGVPETQPELTLPFPDAGQYFGDVGYVRGFLAPQKSQSGPARVLVTGKPVVLTQGAFETSVSRSELGIGGTGAWSVDVDAVYPDGSKTTRKVTFTNSLQALASDALKAVDAVAFDVAPGAPGRFSHRGASLEFEGDALAAKAQIRMQPLRDVDLPALDLGMINVTKGPSRGYRFLPHGQRFKKAARVRLPFDKAKLPKGMSERNIKTYYFDTDLGRWQPLATAAVDEAKGELTALTTHFTDMINAVVQAPESPDAASFNPTQLKDIKAANPATAVNLIEPPTANAMGDARLSYPIELPPGRLGLAPSLGVAYSSAGENGWLGLGWDLASPSITVDSRWGVPRYNAANETESYLIDGEQLAPLTHRGALVPRVANKTFRARVEGGFRRITRHGNSPTTYWWEVRDKDGTAYFYGGRPGSNVDSGAILTDAAGNIFKWGLVEVRDTNNNAVVYTYQRAADTGLGNGLGGGGGNGAEAGSTLYLKTINYTARVNGGTVTPGPYTITFVRGSEITDPAPDARRPDVLIDGRGGFKQVVADRLRRITVTFGVQRVRSYVLHYREGAFRKSLLERIEQYDANGDAAGAVPFHTHHMTYFDEVRQAGGGNYLGFQSRLGWTTHEDGLGSLGLEASALSGHESDGSSVHLYVGVGPVAKKGLSVGFKVGSASSDTDGRVALVDIDGDGLQDKVFLQGSSVSYRRNMSGPGPVLNRVFGPVRPVANLGVISREKSSTLNAGPEAYLSASVVNGFVGLNLSTTDTETSAYFTDVNGDGLTDIVVGRTVLFNRLNASGDPVFAADSTGTPYPIGAGAVESGILTAEMQAIAAREQQANPKIDTLRRWVAPYAGTVAISGTVALIQDTSPERAAYTTADGVRVSIERSGTQLWTQAIAATDYSPKTPTGVAGVTVAKGDAIYFRVQSVDDGAYDQVAWAPVITYTGVPAGATAADGNNPYVFDAARDFTLLPFRGALARMPADGTVNVMGTLAKSAVTSDAITVEVVKNGTVTHTQSIAPTTTGNIAINATNIAVLSDKYAADGTQTQTGDTLELRLRIDSRIDLADVTWLPSAPPRIIYTSAPDLPSGSPLPVIDAIASTDAYPEANTTAPLAAWVAPAAGTFTFQADVTGGSGALVVTAKTATAVQRAKTTVTIGTPATFTVTAAAAGEPVFFEFHTRDAALGQAVTQTRIRQVVGGAPQAPDLPSALYWSSPVTVLAQDFRGWTHFGYDGNGPAATQPVTITNGDLTLASLGTIDPVAYRDAILAAIANGTAGPGLPTALRVFPYYPNVVLSRLDGQDPELWASAPRLSASRRGRNFIESGVVDRFAGARAVPKIATSEQRAISAGGGITGGPGGLSGSISKADTDSRALLEFRDFNGDQFPDIVASGLSVQFTDQTGGLLAGMNSIGGGPVQSSEADTFSAGLGGTFANSSSNGRGQHDTQAGNPPAANGQTGFTMASLGLSGNKTDGESANKGDLIDINGDGLPDYVSQGVSADTSGDRPVTVRLNLGYRFGAAETWGADSRLSEGENKGRTVGGSIGFNSGDYGFSGGINQSDNESWSLAAMQDVNGDGLPDRVRVSARNANAVSIGFNTGAGFMAYQNSWGTAAAAGFANSRQTSRSGGLYFTVTIPTTPAGAPFIIINPGADFSDTMGRSESSLVDINGDGYADHVTSSDDDAMSVALNPHGRTNLLQGVTRPLGATIALDYTRTGNTYDQPQSRWALSRVEVNDGPVTGDGSDRMLTTIAYADGFYERRERAFYGYRTVTTTQHDTLASGDPAYRRVTQTFANRSYYLKGLLETETLTDAAGAKFTETQNTYVLRNEADLTPLANPADLTAVGFPQLARTDKRWFEGQAAAGKTTYETFAYDKYGNVTTYFDASEAPATDDVNATITYHEDLAPYIVGKANAITVTGNGNVMRQRTATFQPGTGNMLEARQLLAGGAFAQSNMVYLADGNLQTITGPANHSGQRYARTYTYEPVATTHVASVTDSFGYVSTATYDLRWGLPTLSRDINAKDITTTYDAIGRVSTVTGPYQQGTGLATIAFDYQLNNATHPVAWARTRHIDPDRNATDFIETFTHVDGLKRAVQVKKDHALSDSAGAISNVLQVSGRMRFDAFGRTYEQYYPTTVALGAGPTLATAYDGVTPTRTTFDVLDRPLTVANPANETTRFVYGFGPDRDGTQQFLTRVTDAKNIPREIFRDVDDDISSVKLINNSGAQILWTSYQYDPLDQITQVRDAKNNLVSAVYDNFGRRTQLTAPDTGMTEFVFDTASNLTGKITPNLRAAGQSIAYAYDFNRIATKTYPQNPANNVTYTYGGPGATFNRAGRAWRITAEDSFRELDFGPLGEVVKEVHGIADTISTGPDPVFTTLFRYDTWNRLQALTYNDGEVLDFNYDSGGSVTDISGLKLGNTYNYLTKLGYDKFGSRVFLQYGNGTQTTYAYNPLHRRLATQVAKTASNRNFINNIYTYDPVGNITALDSDINLDNSGQPGGATTYTFGYDDLHQLTSSSGIFDKRSGTSFTHRYTLAMSYDEIHNITVKNQRAFRKHRSSGAETPTQTLTYNAGYTYGNAATPHSATRIGPMQGTRSFDYLYDANGNNGGYNLVGTGVTRRIAWDEENRMQQVTENTGQVTTFKYADGDTRVSKRGNNGETMYVNEWYVASLGRNTKHVFAGTARIATKQENPPGTNPPNTREDFQYFYHSDHLGTTAAVTDRVGQVWQNITYFPFGEEWVQEGTNNSTIPYRFTGKEFDEETRLAYFGARYYDPRTSVWQSPDPALGRFLNVTKTTFSTPRQIMDWRTNIQGVGHGGMFEPRNLSVASYSHQSPLNVKDPDGQVIETVADVVLIIYDVVVLVREPSWDNAIALGLDVAGAATPGGTGFGPAYRAAKSASNAVDATKVGSKVDDVAAAAAARSKKDDFFGDKEYYRGAKDGQEPHFNPKDNEFKVDRDTGFVKGGDAGRGVSLFDNPEKLRERGFVPHKVDKSSVPDTLTIEQRGRDDNHFEITPREGANLTPQQYRQACSSIVCLRD